MTKWRIIKTETHDAYMNMALDEACKNAMVAGKVPPTIRFYRWQPSAVSIGYFQSMNDEVATKICKQKGVNYIRRITGGGAVYHDYEGEITYSILGPEELFPKGILESYELICGWIVDACKKLGIEDAKFIPINDIVAGESVFGHPKKISGNAQTRRSGILLQHGTILIDVDVAKMFSLLTVGQDKMADKIIQAVEERVSSIHNLKPNLSREDIENTLIKSFTNNSLVTPDNIEIGTWTEEELAEAKKLAAEKYSTDDWNFMR